MKNLTKTKAFWVIISIFLSFFLWIYVTGSVTDEVTRTFTGIPVDIVGEDYLEETKNLAITGLNTNTVAVNISGPRRIVSGLSADNLSAQIDVSKLSQTAYATMQYSIAYPNGTDTSSLSVSRKIPESLSFQVSKIVQKEIAVRGSFDGSTADGYTAEAPVFEPSTIVISGAENELKDISHAFVTFSSDNVTSTYSEETGFVLYDYDGNPVNIEGVECSTYVVKATLPILMAKDVNLSVNLVYGAGANEENVKVTIEPDIISLAGDSSLLNNLNKIVLGTVDLSSFEQTTNQTFVIPLDNNIKNISGFTEATVHIEVLGLQTMQFKVNNLSFENVTDGYKASIKTSSITVNIRGTEEQLSKIKDTDIRAVADLTDYNETTGEQMVSVKIFVDNIEDVGAVGNYTMSIMLEKE